MKIIAVNVGQLARVEINGRPITTGINKLPVASAVWLRKLGFDGDQQADLTVHGGEHQAAYCYPCEHYAHWQSVLGRTEPLTFGTFGENLTTIGLLETEVYIGDVYRFGKALVQVTAPRVPCFKFGHKIGRPDILKEFLHSGYSGFYLRVLEEGRIAAGDDISLVERDPAAITVRMILGLQKLSEGDGHFLRKALLIQNLEPRLKRELEARLAEV